MYVRCRFGYNRAPPVVTAHLMPIEGLSPADALDLLRCARPRAFPLGPADFAVHAARVARYADRSRRRARERGEGPAAGPDADPPPDSAPWRNAARAIPREVLAAPEEPSISGGNAPARRCKPPARGEDSWVV